MAVNLHGSADAYMRESFDDLYAGPQFRPVHIHMDQLFPEGWRSVSPALTEHDAGTDSNVCQFVNQDDQKCTRHAVLYRHDASGQQLHVCEMHATPVARRRQRLIPRTTIYLARQRLSPPTNAQTEYVYNTGGNTGGRLIVRRMSEECRRELGVCSPKPE